MEEPEGGRAAARAILVVDDDQRVTFALRRYLEREGYAVRCVGDGQGALELARSETFDLILLDLTLPLVDGLDVCRRLRATGDVPIVILTARTSLDERLRGLEAGADDYVGKPFSPREVVARVRAVLRRSGRGEPRRLLVFANLEIDRAARSARVDGTPLGLTATEFKLLETLALEDGSTFSRARLIEQSLGWDYRGNDRTIDTHVLNLRTKLGPAAAALVTVVGSGYRFDGRRLGA